MNRDFWSGRSVLITGHTGFKGGWLALWLCRLGAQVQGYALDPVGQPNFFDVVGIGEFLKSDQRADLREGNALKAAVSSAMPEVVFHLAAQPLVYEGYSDPVGTFGSNVMGTVNVLEAVRDVESVRAVVVITTDKVYQNREWSYPYRERDRLGGHDPYSASKAATELVVSSYRDSFFAAPDGPRARLATARAGNVIGGGDWALNRLVPDCLRAFGAGEKVTLRHPDAVRPWQHVLDPLDGYLTLAERLCAQDGEVYVGAWNFGPDPHRDATVGDVAAMVAEEWGEGALVENAAQGERLHEAGLLRLDSSRARQELGWKPRWSLAQSLARTVAWEKARLDEADMNMFSLADIDAYEQASG